MVDMMELKDILCDELQKIADKGTISAGDLEMVHKLTDSIKNILKIEMLEEGDYSSDGDWRATGSYSRGRGNSYGRHYVRGHYSRNDAREDMRSSMRRMMDDGRLSEADRSTLQRAMDMI